MTREVLADTKNPFPERKKEQKKKKEQKQSIRGGTSS